MPLRQQRGFAKSSACANDAQPALLNGIEKLKKPGRSSNCIEERGGTNLVRISGKPRVSRNGPETSEGDWRPLNPMASSVVSTRFVFFNCTPAPG
jgi:hypothetical protein